MMRPLPSHPEGLSASATPQVGQAVDAGCSCSLVCMLLLLLLLLGLLTLAFCC